MKIRAKVKKRLLLILAVVTGVCLVHMIWVRVSAIGYSLITMNSVTGRHIAAWYNPSVVLFVIFAVILSAWLFANYLKNKKNSDNLKENKNFSKNA